MKRILSLLLLNFSLGVLHAEIGATQEESVARYGKPIRDGMKESGLLFFQKGSLCYIAHFYRGHCDVMSIFSSQESMGLHEELSDAQIAALLKSEGGTTVWNPVPRFSINGVWNSADYKSFAIYDTMRHKLAIMTHDAYMREKAALAPAHGAHTPQAMHE
jgi:hypothetical protein